MLQNFGICFPGQELSIRDLTDVRKLCPRSPGACEITGRVFRNRQVDDLFQVVAEQEEKSTPQHACRAPGTGFKVSQFVKRGDRRQCAGITTEDTESHRTAPQSYLAALGVLVCCVLCG